MPKKGSYIQVNGRGCNFLLYVLTFLALSPILGWLSWRKLNSMGADYSPWMILVFGSLESAASMLMMYMGSKGWRTPPGARF